MITIIEKSSELFDNADDLGFSEQYTENNGHL